MNTLRSCATRHTSRMKPIVLRSGEGEQVRLPQSSIVIKAGTETTDGRFALSETTLEPGFPGPNPMCTARPSTCSSYSRER